MVIIAITLVMVAVVFVVVITIAGIIISMLNVGHVELVGCRQPTM